MKLYREHVEMSNNIQHIRVAQMDSQDLKPEYQDLRAVPSESQDHAYLVGKVSVLTKPFPDADATADRTGVIVCGCPAFHYQESAGFENGDMSVEELGECKHAGAYREIRAKQDNQQDTLI